MTNTYTTTQTGKILVKNLIQYRRKQLNSHVINLADEFLYAIDDSDYIDDAIHDAAYNYVDCDYIHLRRWLYENDTDCSCTDPDELMLDAFDLCLIDTNDYDFYRHIQIAQSLGYEEILRKNLPEILLIKSLMVISETRGEITRDELYMLENINWSDYISLREIRSAVENVLEPYFE